MALAFEVVKGLDFEVWFGKGCSNYESFVSTFGIATKLPWQESSSISPYFFGRNHATFQIKCIVAHKTLFSPGFYCENKAKGCPIFMVKIW